MYLNTTGSNNTAIGYNTGLSAGSGTGSGNTILGANVTGLATTLSNNIILANGTGAIKAQNDGTNWTMQGTVTAPTFIGALTGNATNVSGTVAVANGGTGAATLAANNVLLGNGTGALQAVAPGTSGNVLTSNGTTWTSAAASGGLPTTGNAVGNMLYWNGTAWVKVAAGTNGQTLTFYNGAPVWTGTISYANTVTSSTGKIWMDRNLGATQVATSPTDAASYGDLYQWGRGSDGHQLRTSTTIGTKSDAPVHGSFITGSTDWRTTPNDNLWLGVNGINNPCPSGYRIPTQTELEAERGSWGSSNAASAFASPLKLPVAGYRYGDGSLSTGTYGYYWSSTVTGTTNAHYLYFDNGNGSINAYYRAFGFSVRCLKD